MAYLGYLVKVGSYTIPLSKIKQESYKVTYSTLDLDSYRDADGKLHREALDHKVGKVEFNLVMMNNRELNEIMSSIRANYTNGREKKAQIWCYIPEYDNYLVQDMYVPDIEFDIRNIDTVNNVINYGEIRLAFIGY